MDCGGTGDGEPMARRRAWLVGLGMALALPGAGAASATELLDGELVPAATPVLQNAGGTVRLEQSQLDAVGRRVFMVPEPGALWQLSSGVGLLALLYSRRRTAAPPGLPSAVEG